MSERSPEVSFDAFGPSEPLLTHFVGDDCEPDGHRAETEASEGDRVIEPGPDPFATAVEAAQAHHEAVYDPPRADRPHAKNVTPKPRYPMAVVWGSATGGQGHVVAIIGVKPEGGPVVRCTTCEAAILGGRDCWAADYTRLMLE